MKRGLWLCGVGVLFSVTAGAAKAAAPSAARASVDWNRQVLRGTGAGAPDVHAYNPAQARLGAEKSAQRDAVLNLLALAVELPVDSERTVGDELAKNPALRSELEAALSRYKVLERRPFSDGGLLIDVEVPLAAVTSRVTPPPLPAEAPATSGKSSRTGLIVDARGLKLRPVLAPRLLEPGGTVLFSAQMLQPDARTSSGPAAYVDTWGQAQRHSRAGGRPLIVKVARAQGGDLVLRKSDARRLRGAAAGFLAEGRVVIVR